MIIEYTRSAVCKDCVYCSYYYKMKKDGTLYKRKSYKCDLHIHDISPKWIICNEFKL